MGTSLTIAHPLLPFAPFNSFPCLRSRCSIAALSTSFSARNVLTHRLRVASQRRRSRSKCTLPQRYLRPPLRRRMGILRCCIHTRMCIRWVGMYTSHMILHLRHWAKGGELDVTMQEMFLRRQHPEMVRTAGREKLIVTTDDRRCI